MQRVVWTTDIHLNFLPPDQVGKFLLRIADARPDAVLVGGDIGEAPSVVPLLEQMDSGLDCPIYFVLGNHDYYFGSIRGVREEIRRLCAARPKLVWLGGVDDVALAHDVGLVGHDGWADARLGDYERSLVMMNDYRLIDELARANKAQRWPLLKELADEAVDHFRRVLPPALAKYREVVLLTHVPPFREACWYQGQISNDEWLPHFTAKAVGDALLDVMREHPDQQLTVLCGHTHGQGEAHPLANLTVYTGGAEYGAPTIQRVFEWPWNGRSGKRG